MSPAMRNVSHVHQNPHAGGLSWPKCSCLNTANRTDTRESATRTVLFSPCPNNSRPALSGSSLQWIPSNPSLPPCLPSRIHNAWKNDLTLALSLSRGCTPLWDDSNSLQSSTPQVPPVGRKDGLLSRWSAAPDHGSGRRARLHPALRPAPPLCPAPPLPAAPPLCPAPPRSSRSTRPPDKPQP